MTRRLAFVPVRYGDDVIGGAEMVVRELADGLAQRGWEVDVLTGCTRDHFREVAWFPPGETELPHGARLIRFSSEATRGRADRVLGNRRLERGDEMDEAASYRWLNDDVRVPGLFEYLVDHVDEYRVVVVAPYPYWTTVASAVVAPERTVLMPCLHDEPVARLPVYDRMFRECRGRWFLTDPEAEFARCRWPALADHTVIGSGVAVPDSYDPTRFRRRFAIDGPFVLYVGRRESAKGSAQLVQWFTDAVAAQRSPLRLVTCGPGRAPVPPASRSCVIDVGPLSSRDRDDAMAAAAAVVQPSANESFSRTMMEAWLAGSHVIANGASAVSRWHCERSCSGMVYEDAAEFGACLRDVLAPDWSHGAHGGRDYVLREYTWPVVLDRVEASIDEWFPPTERATR